jgi:ribosomal protein L37AE/L43A
MRFEARKTNESDCIKCHCARGIWRLNQHIFICDSCLADLYAYLRDNPYDENDQSVVMVTTYARSYQAPAYLAGWLPGTVVRRMDRRRA